MSVPAMAPAVAPTAVPIRNGTIGPALRPDCLSGSVDSTVATLPSPATDQQASRSAHADRNHPPVWQVNRAMPNTGRRKDSGPDWIVIGGTRTVYVQTPAMGNRRRAIRSAAEPRSLLNRQQRWRVLPNVFQAIERPLVEIENMDDDITIVDQNPS